MMKLPALFIICLEIYSVVQVAGTRCGGSKCPLPATKRSTNEGNQDKGSTDSSQLGSDVIEGDKFDCCACGEATYDITFTGKWTRATYPRHFPGHMARWSALIGSSHSKDYTVWRYGGMASPGVKRVSEWGAVDKLEQEMKNQGAKVFSIIKTRGIWKSDGKISTTFKADRKRNLVSALSKMFPSPDWSVGVDRLNLCSVNCTWKQTIIEELYPWDAGTDDGISFTSVNSKSVPQRPITKITNNLHRYAEASFSGGAGSDVTRPFGQIKLKLMNTRGDCGKRKSRPPSPEKAPRIHCKVSRWSSWTTCSVTCGRGYQVRGRAVIKPAMNDGIQCPQLTETRPCVMNNCTDVTKSNCLLSRWSAWSECNGTCNRGGRLRSRNILRREGPGGKPCPDLLYLFKWRKCRLPKCPSEKNNDCIVTEWSPWTTCSKKCNRGRKFRIRKILQREKPGGVKCPAKLKEKRKCVPVKCSA